jgi:hypothetical protein
VWNTITWAETEKVLGMLKVIWPEHQVNDGVTTLYYELLSDLPLVSVMGAAKWHMAEDRWFPKPSDLRDRAERLMFGILRHDSYPCVTGLDRQVRLALALAAPSTPQLEA